MAQKLLVQEINRGKSEMDYHVLCIDDDAEFLTGLKFDLQKVYRCTTVQTVREGLEIIQRESVDLVLLDVGLGEENGIEGLRLIKKADPTLDVVMVSGYSDSQTIVAAVRAGASDYMCKPFEMGELIAVVEKLEQVKKVRNHHDALISDLNKSDTKSRILGVSQSFRDILGKADRLKGYDANILIEGESGTGKELLARYIHNLENDPRRPFIAINCAAIPDTLIESEFFGYEKGAFTGASCRRIGKFELASGGDIFLDEISALKVELQAKILRVLQEKEICRIGGSSAIKVAFRVISATNDDIEGMIARGLFRMDLFHRLRVVHLRIPPLRKRAEDIPLLTKHFLDKYTKPNHRKEISDETIELFEKYRWPGNIRELENLVHNLIIMVPNGTIDADNLPDWIRGTAVMKDNGEDFAPYSDGLTLKECLEQTEKIYLEKLLAATGGNKSKAAIELKVSRTTLHSRLKELGIK